MNQPPLFSPDFEADALPFGPALKPVLLLEIAQEIRAFGGQVWHYDKIGEPFGSLFRAEIGTLKFRVFVPMPGNKTPIPPQEKGSPIHVVSTLPALREWLISLAL